MDPVTASITIDRPREEVFDYLADIANHPEFTDHYLKDWRLTREDSWGEGAGARYRIDRKKRFSWADMTFIEIEPPFRITAVGRGGKFNRVKTFSTWTLSPAGGGTKVEYMIETEPALLSDRLAEVGFRRWLRRRSSKALHRLRLILEEDADRGTRVTVAGV